MTRSKTLYFLGCLCAIAAAGCRSDLSQQLLERELRLQEDQIYQLQDELHFKAARLDRIAVENASLKKQLGIVDPDASLPTRSLPPPGVAAPARPTPAAPLAPPSIEVPPIQAPTIQAPVVQVPAIDAPGIEFVPPPRTGPTAPSIDGVPPPPLPKESPRAPEGPSFRGTSFEAAPDLPPPVKQLSYEESLAGEPGITHLVINPSRTVMFDGDGDGRSDGVTVVFEPRDQDERLVSAVGDVVVTAFDASAPPDSPPVASWEIPSREALQHFRRTSRARGLHFVLRWAAGPPSAEHLRILVRMTTFEGRAYEGELTTAK